MICKVIKHFPNSNGWNVGDIVDITDPSFLMEQGLVEPSKAAPKSKKK